MKWLAVWIPIAGLISDGISHLIQRHATRLCVWECLPRFRFMIYGTEEHARGFSWYVLIKLPVSHWEQIDYGRRCGWTQLHIQWQQGRGWRSFYI